MKNVFTKLVAMMLVVWYSLSVIGFDVHTCSDSGESYIATVISGTDCSDIHPEHAHEACSCCHCHAEHKQHDESAENAVCADSCCTDDWQMMELTGVRYSEQDDDQDKLQYGSALYLAGLSTENIIHYTFLSGSIPLHIPDLGKIIPLDFQRTYGVWRI